MAPVIRELGRRRAKHRLQPVTCVTAQHREMLDQVLGVFGIRPNLDLNLMRERQTLSAFTASAVTAVTEVLQRERPHLVLVQGDTTTAMGTALAAFYEKIPVGHIEAGLRTGDRHNPFPEELNRRVIGMLADLHFAPTRRAVENLIQEEVPPSSVFLTGNTVIDALVSVAQRPPSRAASQLLKDLGMDERAPRNGDGPYPSPERSRAEGWRCLRYILVTAHRRESFGLPLSRICRALREISLRNPDVRIVYALHLNPAAREPALRILRGNEQVRLIEPLSYEPFAQLLKRVHLILTDSGGIQEEAPALGKPVLVLREETERPEGVEAGCAKIVGTDPERIIFETERLLRDESEYKRMARSVNPYGDGRAAERIVNVIFAHREVIEDHPRASVLVSSPHASSTADVSFV